MPDSEIQNHKPGPRELFRTWFVKLPGDQLGEKRALIMEKCGWTLNQWYNRLYDRTPLSKLEMKAIVEVAGQDIFFVDQEGDAQQ